MTNILMFESRAETFLILSDATPNPLLRSIESMYPRSSRVSLLCVIHQLILTTQMGMITAPTPFITSRPHTLFHGPNTYSSGAVGLSLPRDLGPKVAYPLQPLTEPIKITA